MRLDLYDNSDFDRGAGRFKEALWVLCKCLFFLNPFPWPSSLRTFWLRLFGAKLGANVVVRSGVNVTFPWRFETGSHVWIGEDVCLLSLATITLGSHVCLSQRAFICTGSHQWRAETFDLIVRPTQIDSSVWIAAAAFVGPGVTIGENSLVCAGAVIVNSMPAASIARGNPALITRKDGAILEGTAP